VTRPRYQKPATPCNERPACEAVYHVPVAPHLLEGNRVAGVVVLLLLAASPLTGSARADEALWRRLAAGGHVVLLRHATTTPGVGDPTGFRLDDCVTQRNLTEAGREESRRIGAAFKARAIPVGRVLSSRWCRCLETARLAFGSAEPWEPLSSLFADRTRQAEQTRAFRALAGEKRGAENTVLVTHGANILAFVGVSPAMAEMVIVTPQGDGTFTVTGRLPAP
jgi:phosphohistidine phosphatase SixA